MKNQPSQAAATFVSPPDTTWREDVMQQHSSTHAKDLFLVRKHQVKEHVQRLLLASCSSPQRIRASQMEPRTAQDCHVRIQRRMRRVG